jgi:hypothetical protein
LTHCRPPSFLLPGIVTIGTEITGVRGTSSFAATAPVLPALMRARIVRAAVRRRTVCACASRLQGSPHNI